MIPQMDRTMPRKAALVMMAALILMLSAYAIGTGGVSGVDQCVQQLSPTVQLNNGVQSETRRFERQNAWNVDFRLLQEDEA